MEAAQSITGDDESTVRLWANSPIHPVILLRDVRRIPHLSTKKEPNETPGHLKKKEKKWPTEICGETRRLPLRKYKSSWRIWNEETNKWMRFCCEFRSRAGRGCEMRPHRCTVESRLTLAASPFQPLVSLTKPLASELEGERV